MFPPGHRALRPPPILFHTPSQPHIPPLGLSIDPTPFDRVDRGDQINTQLKVDEVQSDEDVEMEERPVLDDCLDDPIAETTPTPLPRGVRKRRAIRRPGPSRDVRVNATGGAGVFLIKDNRIVGEEPLPKAMVDIIDFSRFEARTRAEQDADRSPDEIIEGDCRSGEEDEQLAGEEGDDETSSGRGQQGGEREDEDVEDGGYEEEGDIEAFDEEDASDEGDEETGDGDEEEEDDEDGDEEDNEDGDEEDTDNSLESDPVVRTRRVRSKVQSDSSSEAEDTMIDLSEHTFREGDPLDSAFVPLAGKLSCDRCRKYNRDDCVPIWHAFYSTARVLCLNCQMAKSSCSFSLHGFDIHRGPELTRESNAQTLRNFHKAEKHVSSAKKNPSYRKTSRAYREMVRGGLIVESGGTPSISKSLRGAARKAKQEQKGKRKREQDSAEEDAELTEEGDGASRGDVALPKKIAKTVNIFAKSAEVRELTPVPSPLRIQEATQLLADIRPYEEVILNPSSTTLELMDALAGLKIAYIHNASALATFRETVIAQQDKGLFLQGEARRTIEERTQPVAGPSGGGEGA